MLNKAYNFSLNGTLKTSNSQGMTDYFNDLIAQQLSKEDGLSRIKMSNAFKSHYGVPDMTDYSSEDQDGVFLLFGDGYTVYSKNETLLGKTLLREAFLKDDDSLDSVLLLIPLDRSAESESLLVYDNGDGKLKRIFQGQSWSYLKKNEPVSQWKQPGTDELSTLFFNTEITQIQEKLTTLESKVQSMSEEVARNDGRLDSYGVLLSSLIPVILAIIAASKIWSRRRERALEKQIENLSQQIENLSKKMERARKKSKR